MFEQQAIKMMFQDFLTIILGFLSIKNLPGAIFSVIESLFLRLCGFSLTHLAMIPVVVLQPSSSFPSGHDQGGGEVVVANLFAMDFVLVVIVRRCWEGKSR